MSSFTLNEVNTCQSMGARQKTAIVTTATQNKILLMEIVCCLAGAGALFGRLESSAVAIFLSVISC
jgi:energy-converting hydrogenase Eha subunit H